MLNIGYTKIHLRAKTTENAFKEEGAGVSGMVVPLKQGRSLGRERSHDFYINTLVYTMASSQI